MTAVMIYGNIHMITTELIKKLQQMVEDHKPHEEVMGPHEIVIDVFEKLPGNASGFRYAGFSPDITIEYSGDGVYPILSAFAKEK